MKSSSHITDNIKERKENRSVQELTLCDVLYRAGVAIINVASLRQGG